MNTHRETVTRSIETDTSPELIVQVLSDPRRIPQWAPGFADRVETDEGGCWRVTKGEKTFPIEVVAFGPARTVDYLREVTPERKGGAFLRVMPRATRGKCSCDDFAGAPRNFCRGNRKNPGPGTATADETMRLPLTRRATEGSFHCRQRRLNYRKRGDVVQSASECYRRQADPRPQSRLRR